MFKHLFYLFVALTLFRCANIQPPTGGPRDTESPKITNTIPENESVNFSEKTIELTFNEPINAGTLKSEIIFSPSINTAFKVKYNKNTVTIDFEEPLPKGVTYTVKFGKGIKDITEGNTLSNTESLVFSTGDALDSLSITGSVHHILHKSKTSNALVALYKPVDSLDITSDKPLYYSYTDQQGIFNINYLPNQLFTIVAFTDENNNRIWDKKKEAIAFINQPIEPGKEAISLITFSDNSFEPKILKRKIYNDRISIEFNKGIVYNSITPNILEPIIDENGKKIIFFNKENTLNDSLQLAISYGDSSGTKYIEKISFKFNPDFKSKDEPLLKLLFPKKGEVNPNKATISLKINEPITINKNKFYLIEDTLERMPADSLNYTVEFDSLLHTLTYEITHQAKKSLTLLFPGSFINDKKQPDSIINKIPLTIKQENEYGLLSGKINSTKKNYIIQLLSDKYELIDQVEMKNQFRFTYIKPGTYLIRVLEDQNNNGKWDNGDLKNKQHPEPVYFYKEEIFLKANWELSDIVIELSTQK